MNPRIAVVTNTPESFRLLLRAQLDRARDEGFEVHCVSGPGAYVATLRRDGFTAHEVPLTRLLRPGDDVRALAAMVRLFRRERFALVHTHTPKAAVIGQLAARIAGVPHVVNTVHGLLAHDDSPPLRRLLLEPLDRLTCGLSTAVLSQSAEDVERATRRHICAFAKIRRLGQGIDLARFDPTSFTGSRRQQIRRALGLPLNALVVTIVARFSAEKGYREFFAMAREIACHRRNVHFVVVGTTLDERDPVDVGPAQQRLQGSLTVLVDRDDMPEVYAASDVVVLPTYREGFPRSLVEAGAMGVPVVSTRIRGCREAVVDGETGILVPPRDATALVTAVTTLLDDERRRREMGVRAARRARVEFDERRVSDRVVGLYRALLSDDSAATPRRPWTVVKRAFDVVAAAVLLIAASPLLALIAATIRARMGRPVLYRQERTGRGGRIFTLVKFRTMHDAPAGAVAPPDEVRLTPLGRWLRATSLDELPELWNVLRGDMSLVGPRPLLPRYLGRYSPEQARRHDVRPGITGLAQVRGRNALSWRERFALDVWYVDHQSLRLDVWILWRTLGAVCRRTGINAPGHETMPEFLGNEERADGVLAVGADAAASLATIATAGGGAISAGDGSGECATS